MEDGILLCSICGNPVEDKYGNNAYPVNEGRCCNGCNEVYVIPARIRIMTGVSTKEQEYIKPACGLDQQDEYLARVSDTSIW